MASSNMLFLLVNYFLALCKCAQWDDMYVVVSVKSLIEYNTNGNSIPSNTFDSFTTNDWINESVFRPELTNNADVQFIMTNIQQSNEIQYKLNIHNWPWKDINNFIEFCFNIYNPHQLNLTFEQQTDNFTINENNNYIICHELLYDDYISYIQYIHYEYSDHEYYEATLYNISYHNSFNNSIQNVFNAYKSPIETHFVWVIIVSSAAGYVLCMFVLLILYLIHSGTFDEHKKPDNKSKKKVYNIYDPRVSTLKIKNNKFTFNTINDIKKDVVYTTSLPPISPIAEEIVSMGSITDSMNVYNNDNTISQHDRSNTDSVVSFIIRTTSGSPSVNGV